MPLDDVVHTQASDLERRLAEEQRSSMDREHLLSAKLTKMRRLQRLALGVRSPSPIADAAPDELAPAPAEYQVPARACSALGLAASGSTSRLISGSRPADHGSRPADHGSSRPADHGSAGLTAGRLQVRAQKRGQVGEALAVAPLARASSSAAQISYGSAPSWVRAGAGADRLPSSAQHGPAPRRSHSQELLAATARRHRALLYSELTKKLARAS